MKCPYCSKEMLSGYLYNGSQPLQWIPEGEKPLFFNFDVAHYAVELKNKFSFFKGGYRAETYYCDRCHVVISKTKE
ncbi:MAG: MarR family transcriptional regulator [Clostridia bacterium]|nr:MarR family transcriptional regulator [Clostridia bacterium]